MTSGRRRYFVNVSAGGFSGVVDEKLTPEIKAAWGPLADLRSAAAALPELQAYRTTMIVDDIEELVIDLYNVVVANGQFASGGLPIAPQANLSDGLLDCCAGAEMSGSGNGAAGRGGAFWEAYLL
jgi:diacylglycerol kinase (ATP)